MATQSKKPSAKRPATKGHNSPPKGSAKVTVALAAISPLTASQVGKGFAAAVKRAEGAQFTFLHSCEATAKLIGCPLTSGQYDKQIAPAVREAFNAQGMRHIAETTRASMRSRLKTFSLAVNSGIKGMTPIAGETLPTFLARVSEPLASAKLADGRFVWDADRKKSGRAAGTKAPPKSGGVNKLGSAGSSNDQEGGLDVRPKEAAALILCGGNANRAKRLVIVLGNYAAEFDKWTDTILTTDDKAALKAA